MRWIDEPGGTFKFIDDVKQPFFDKNPASDSPKAPSDVLTWPSAAPFVLSTPHHSMAWTQAFPGAQRDAAESYAGQIRQYEEVLSQYAQAEVSGQLGPDDRETGDRLYADYVRLVEEYRQLTEA